MLPKWHILLGFIFSLLIWIIFPSTGLLFFLAVFLSSFLVDVDHYVYYAFKCKDISLPNAYRSCLEQGKRWDALPQKEKNKYKITPLFLHGFEFWLLLIIASFFNKIFFFIFLGVIFHMAIDLIALYKDRDPLYAKLSQIYVLATNKNKKELR